MNEESKEKYRQRELMYKDLKAGVNTFCKDLKEKTWGGSSWGNGRRVVER